MDGENGCYHVAWCLVASSFSGVDFMGSDLPTIKAKVLEILEGDSDLIDMVRADDIFISYGKRNENDDPVMPSITVDDAGEVGEVAGLNDGFDDVNRDEFFHPTIQIDVYASTPADRDLIVKQIKKTLLNAKADLKSVGCHYLQNPLIVPLDEPRRVPPIFRKAMSYSGFYILEAAV